MEDFETQGRNTAGCIIERQVLFEAVNLACVSTTKDPNVSTSSLLFEVDEDVLMIKSTNEHIMTRVPCALIDSDASVSFLIEASPLQKWLKHLAGEEVKFEVGLDENGEVLSVELECGDARTPFRSLKVSEFLDFEEYYLEKEDLFEATGGDLANALSFVSPFALKDVTGSRKEVFALTVVGLKDSLWIGGNQKSVSFYKSEGVEGSLNISIKEVPSVLNFCKKFNAEGLMISENKRFYFLELESGVSLGYRKTVYEPVAGFRRLKLDRLDMEQLQVVLDREALLKAFGALQATAADEALTMKMALEEDQDHMLLSMRDTSKKGRTEIKVPCKLQNRGVSSDFLELYAKIDSLEAAVKHQGTEKVLLQTPGSNQLQVLPATDDVEFPYGVLVKIQ